MTSFDSKNFIRGLADGAPVCAGYFAVAFALGIAARQIGMTALQAGAMSLGMVASAGEYAAILLLGSGAGVVEMVITCLVVNLRYLLMSCSLSQKLDPAMPLRRRFFLAHTITDELFGLDMAQEGYVDFGYSLAAFLISAAGWTTGTMLGVHAGNLLPDWLTAGLGVALYGMFLAIIVPPAKKNTFLGGLVAVSMVLSGLFVIVPFLKEISDGFRVILLTVVLSAMAALLRPLPEVSDTEAEEVHDA